MTLAVQGPVEVPGFSSPHGLGERVYHGFFPSRGFEETDLALVAGDDINLSVSGVVCCSSGSDDAPFVFADGMLFPIGVGDESLQGAERTQ